MLEEIPHPDDLETARQDLIRRYTAAETIGRQALTTGIVRPNPVLAGERPRPYDLVADAFPHGPAID